MAATGVKRKGLLENCCPTGLAPPDSVLPLKRLRLNEAPMPFPTSLASPTGAQPVTPTPSQNSPAGPQYCTAGVPAVSPQQRLPTIPEIHSTMEPVWRQHAPSASPAPEALWAQAAQLVQAPHLLGQELPWPGLAGQQSQKTQLGQQWPWQQQQQQHPQVQQQRATSPTSHLGKRNLHSVDSTVDAAFGSSSSEDDSAMDECPQQQQAHRRRVGGEGYRLVIPEALTSIPGAVLDGPPALGLAGVELAPPVGDLMAVVPYVPPEAVVAEACRRTAEVQQHHRRPSSPLEAWCHQQGLMFDNERPLPDASTSSSDSVGRPRVLIEELNEAADGPEAMEE
ncbi:hypothetical protein N2152v2_009315 [Parachlorella kessleri]